MSGIPYERAAERPLTVSLRALVFWVIVAVIAATVVGYYFGRSENRVVYAATYDAVTDMLNDVAAARHLEMHVDSIVAEAQEVLGQ